MNPGTLLFIVLGIVGLIIYISKAIKTKLKENFTVIDESQISNKGKDGLQSLKDGTLNFESLLGAFSTPDVNLDRSLNTSPSISDFVKFKAGGSKIQEAPVLSPPLKTPATTLNPYEISNKITLPPVLTPSLPVLTPASIINMSNDKPTKASPAITISDIQGTLIPKSTEPFKEKKQKPKNTIVYVPRKCPPMPDMSQYIRKDSIPCWGCNLK